MTSFAEWRFLVDGRAEKMDDIYSTGEGDTRGFGIFVLVMMGLWPDPRKKNCVSQTLAQLVPSRLASV